MNVSDFHFDLPTELIAQHPPTQRGASRLLILDRARGKPRDAMFADLPDALRPGDLLVFNDTKVIPARLFGHKPTGGKVEILIERLLDDRRARAQIRASKPPQPGSRLLLENAMEVAVLARQADFYELGFSQPVLALLDHYGHIPLPPYITRPAESRDRDRYQTIFARHPGAVAAPTAGLHFDPVLLEQLAALGISSAFITLHVGAGTFQPPRVEHVEKHRMHAEFVTVPEQACEKIAKTRSQGGRIIAVGTTTVRSLESAWRDNAVHPFHGDTSIFIYPGYEFRAVDALITNFHLPESTLLMLVAAFAGYANTMHAYRHAVEAGYRFFSYGDAMLIL